MPSDGKTSARGYGTRHQQIVRRLKRELKPGTECRRCGRPMFVWQKLDGGHPPGMSAGDGVDADELEHASCNRSAGALDRVERVRRASLPEW